MSQIKDIALAPSGEMKIDWVERNMPVLRGIGEDFKKTQPFAGLKIALSVHLEAKTAYLCRVLEMGGAEMYVTGSNPGSRRRTTSLRRSLTAAWRSSQATAARWRNMKTASAECSRSAPTS